MLKFLRFIKGESSEVSRLRADAYDEFKELDVIEYTDTVNGYFPIDATKQRWAYFPSGYKTMNGTIPEDVITEWIPDKQNGLYNQPVGTIIIRGRKSRSLMIGIWDTGSGAYQGASRILDKSGRPYAHELLPVQVGTNINYEYESYSSTAANVAGFYFYGTPVSGKKLTIPAVKRIYLFATEYASGSTYGVTSGGAEININPGTSGAFYCDGTNIVKIIETFNGGTTVEAAKKLSTARKINGVGFDGTADITITSDVSAGFVVSPPGRGIFLSAEGQSLNNSPLEVRSNSNTSGDAAMSFHLPMRYAGYFGLNAATNDLFWGGWSVGAVKHKIAHAGNLGMTWGGWASETEHVHPYEFGTDKTKDGWTLFDIHAQKASAGADYDARLVRWGGANGDLCIYNGGTGKICLLTDSGGGVLVRNGGNGLKISSSGIQGNTPNLHLDATGNGAVYIGYSAGTSGTKFCDGAGGVKATVGQNGDILSSPSAGEGKVGAVGNSGELYLVNHSADTERGLYDTGLGTYVIKINPGATRFIGACDYIREHNGGRKIRTYAGTFTTAYNAGGTVTYPSAFSHVYAFLIIDTASAVATFGSSSLTAGNIPSGGGVRTYNWLAIGD